MSGRARRFRQAACSALLAILLGSCAKAPPVPTDSFYRLPTPAGVPALRRPLTTGTLRVAAWQSDGVHGERAVLYTEDAQGITLKQYSYHFWVEPPPRLLQQQLAQYLRAAGAAPGVITQPEGNAELTVLGRLHRFERELTADGIVAHVAFELRLNDRDGNTLLDKEYTLDSRIADPALPATVVALNDAVQRLFAAFAEAAAKVTAARP